MALSALKVGTMLAGKLRIERMIGRGAMGIVLACHDTTLNRSVAVKVMAPQASSEEEARGRFLREAHAASQLASEHMTRVLEVGELDDGTPFFAMELLCGRLLEDVIVKDGPAPVDVAVDWMRQAIDVVAEAHTRGLVHRDLKPANLFLAERQNGPPIVKVLDFGVVKNFLSDRGPSELTTAGAYIGTPAYMAPEQIMSGSPVDPRTDVWALGVTLFELLTGKVPFESTSTPAMLSRILKDPAPSLRSFRPDAPQSIDAIVARCLEKDPAARFANAAELGQALGDLRSPNTSAVTLFDDRAVRALDPPKPKTKLPLLLVLGGFALLSLIGISLAAIALTSRAATPPTSASVSSAAASPPTLPPSPKTAPKGK